MEGLGQFPGQQWVDWICAKGIVLGWCVCGCKARERGPSEQMMEGVVAMALGGPRLMRTGA